MLWLFGRRYHAYEDEDEDVDASKVPLDRIENLGRINVDVLQHLFTKHKLTFAV